MADNQHPIKIDFAKLVNEPNIAKLLTKEQLTKIAGEVMDGFKVDLSSREDWEKRNADGMKLALQVTEDKSFPWPHCANVKFPLVTVAALQFLARVSILTKGKDIAKCDVIGQDLSDEERQRAKRISSHMSYQLIEEDIEWINDDEKAKFSACIMGCAFKKSYFDSVQGINISEHVPAMNLVVNYGAKSLETAERITQLIPMSANKVQEKFRQGLYIKPDESAMTTSDQPLPNELRSASDEAQGTKPNAATSLLNFQVLEQHCWMDMDADGYQEPYVVTVHAGSGEVMRIVARFFDEGDVFRVNDATVRRLRIKSATASDDGKLVYEKQIKKLQTDDKNFILRIEPQHFYTKYTFIPSPDGGFYDLGFSALLGPVNAAVNTLINQQLDAGTMQVTAGGFLGRGVKLKGGRNTFDPFEWKPVDSAGDDLRKNIVPLPVNAPSTVLFQLLGVLIQYGEKISGATDIMTGVSPGQNTPAETSRNTIEQGMMLFSGIYGRMYRSFKSELTKRYRLNQLYLETSPQYVMLSDGKGAMITQDDYKKGKFKVVPAADPAVVSQSQRQQRAMTLMNAAHGNSGYNMYLVNKEFLESNDIANIDMVLPDPAGPNAIPPQPNPKLEIEKGKLELANLEEKNAHAVAVATLQMEFQESQAKISKLEAEASKLLAEADGVEIQQQISAINAQVGAARAHSEGMYKALSIMQQVKSQKLNEQKHELETKKVQQQASQQPGGSGGNTGQGSSGVAASSGDTGAA